MAHITFSTSTTGLQFFTLEQQPGETVMAGETDKYALRGYTNVDTMSEVKNGKKVWVAPMPTYGLQAGRKYVFLWCWGQTTWGALKYTYQPTSGASRHYDAGATAYRLAQTEPVFDIQLWERQTGVRETVSVPSWNAALVGEQRVKLCNWPLGGWNWPQDDALLRHTLRTAAEAMAATLNPIRLSIATGAAVLIPGTEDRWGNQVEPDRAALPDGSTWILTNGMLPSNAPSVGLVWSADGLIDVETDDVIEPPPLVYRPPVVPEPDETPEESGGGRNALWLAAAAAAAYLFSR